MPQEIKKKEENLNALYPVENATTSWGRTFKIGDEIPELGKINGIETSKDNKRIVLKIQRADIKKTEKYELDFNNKQREETKDKKKVIYYPLKNLKTKNPDDDFYLEDEDKEIVEKSENKITEDKDVEKELVLANKTNTPKAESKPAGKKTADKKEEIKPATRKRGQNINELIAIKGSLFPFQLYNGEFHKINIGDKFSIKEKISKKGKEVEEIIKDYEIVGSEGPKEKATMLLIKETIEGRSVKNNPIKKMAVGNFVKNYKERKLIISIGTIEDENRDKQEEIDREIEEKERKENLEKIIVSIRNKDGAPMNLRIREKFNLYKEKNSKEFTEYTITDIIDEKTFIATDNKNKTRTFETGEIINNYISEKLKIFRSSRIQAEMDQFYANKKAKGEIKSDTEKGGAGTTENKEDKEIEEQIAKITDTSTVSYGDKTKPETLKIYKVIELPNKDNGEKFKLIPEQEGTGSSIKWNKDQIKQLLKSGNLTIVENTPPLPPAPPAPPQSPEEITVNEIANLIKEFGITEIVIHSGDDISKFVPKDPIHPTEKEKAKLKKLDEKKSTYSPDHDTRGALFIFDEFNNKNKEGEKDKQYAGNARISYIPTGGNEKNLQEKVKGLRIFLDVGGTFIQVEHDGETKTIHLDHHGKGKLKQPTSATKIMLDVMEKAGILKEKPKWLENLATFINDVDNLTYLDKTEKGKKTFDENYFQNTWPNSLYAMADQIPFDTLVELFKSGKITSPDHIFKPNELNGELGEIKLRDMTLGDLLKNKKINKKGSEEYKKLAETKKKLFEEGKFNLSSGELPFTEEELEQKDLKLFTGIKEKDKDGKEKIIFAVGDFTIAELARTRKMDAINAIKGVNRAIEYTKKRGLETENTRLGKIIYHDFFIRENTDQKNFIQDNVSFIATKAKGYDTFVSFNKENGNFFKINSSHPDLEKIGTEIENAIDGTHEVRGVFVFSPKDPENRTNITEEKLLNLIDPKILENEKKETPPAPPASSSKIEIIDKSKIFPSQLINLGEKINDLNKKQFETFQANLELLSVGDERSLEVAKYTSKLKMSEIMDTISVWEYLGGEPENATLYNLSKNCLILFSEALNKKEVVAPAAAREPAKPAEPAVKETEKFDIPIDPEYMAKHKKENAEFAKKKLLDFIQETEKDYQENKINEKQFEVKILQKINELAKSYNLDVKTLNVDVIVEVGEKKEKSDIENKKADIEKRRIDALNATPFPELETIEIPQTRINLALLKAIIENEEKDISQKKDNEKDLNIKDIKKLKEYYNKQDIIIKKYDAELATLEKSEKKERTDRF